MRLGLWRKSGSKGERVDREGTWRIESEDVTQEANKKKREEWTCGGRGKRGVQKRRRETESRNDNERVRDGKRKEGKLMEWRGEGEKGKGESNKCEGQKEWKGLPERARRRKASRSRRGKERREEPGSEEKPEMWS